MRFWLLTTSHLQRSIRSWTFKLVSRYGAVLIQAKTSVAIYLAAWFLDHNFWILHQRRRDRVQSHMKNFFHMYSHGWTFFCAMPHIREILLFSDFPFLWGKFLNFFFHSVTVLSFLTYRQLVTCLLFSLWVTITSPNATHMDIWTKYP